MSTVLEIERAICTLTPQQLEELYVWLDEHHPQPIDMRLANGIEGGDFESAVQRALEDETAGRIPPSVR